MTAHFSEHCIMGYKKLVPRSYRHSKTRWRLVSPQKNSVFLQIIAQLRDMPQAGKYSEVNSRSTKLFQGILLLHRWKIINLFEKDEAYSSHDDRHTKLKSNYESGDKSCGLVMSTMTVFIIVIVRLLTGISDKTIFSIVLCNS